MLKALRCECRIAFTLTPKGPILIKRDVKKEEENELLRLFGGRPPAMMFVRTLREGKLVPYIPGSSLKGVMRSYAERIARTLHVQQGCCDPFCAPEPAQPITDPNTSCSEKFVHRRDGKRQGRVIRGLDENLIGEVVYRDACPICKLFGCSFLQSRLLVSDGYTAAYDNARGDRLYGQSNYVKLPRRHSVAIDRYTGGAKGGALFDFEVEEQATFAFTLILQNFELWQLGLLAFLFRDFSEQFIPIGAGKSRGLGRVEGKVAEVKIGYFGSVGSLKTGHIPGVDKLLGQNGYGFVADDVVLLPDCPPLHADGPLRHTYTFDAEGSQRLFAAVAPRWCKPDNRDGYDGYIDCYTPPEKMKIAFFNTISQGSGPSGQPGREGGDAVYG
ncbi:MAG: hypothetical protein DDT30_00968 [Dehalococcoidia bacterium]|nr:hypothetical protein [Bacillota bacterium]MBT9142136.1 hypothetical protein [Bacillota bacterium]